MSLSSDGAEEDGDRTMSLREQQRAVTRNRITTALSELIETQHLLDVTMAAVAAQAGVSEPTLYRHFPTKKNLFAALGSELFRKTTAGVAPSSLDELIEFLPKLYEQFAAMEATTRWNLAAPKDEVVRPTATERLPILREALSDALEGLTPAESDALLRGLLLLTSPTSLLYWQDYLGITVEEAAETASWLIRRLAER
jgi:AcrR family transcriptional regulator